ncbi:MAG TPA: hypothetical protein VHE83_07780 [Mycobacteriales bacterium]|nr:hypothetical protein [Mycobacteriales bacterium]
MTSSATCQVPLDIPRLATAGAFLEALAAQDFRRLAATLSPVVALRALVPGGFREWDGRGDTTSAFATWFGDTTSFELLEAVVGEVGVRLHLQWRVRLSADRLGEGWFQVEQQAYADTDERGQIVKLRVLCSGYCPE